MAELEIINSRRVNYKSDFEFLLKVVSQESDGGTYKGFPEYDFNIFLYTENSSKKYSVKYVRKKTNTEEDQYIKCAKYTYKNNQGAEEEVIKVIVDNHKLSVGNLYLEFQAKLYNKDYPDEYQTITSTIDTNIILTEDTSDDLDINEITFITPYVLVDLRLLEESINNVNIALNKKIDTKQDIIEDLEEIRRRSSLGETAAQSPDWAIEDTKSKSFIKHRTHYIKNVSLNVKRDITNTSAGHILARGLHPYNTLVIDFKHFYPIRVDDQKLVLYSGGGPNIYCKFEYSIEDDTINLVQTNNSYGVGHWVEIIECREISPLHEMFIPSSIERTVDTNNKIDNVRDEINTVKEDVPFVKGEGTNSAVLKQSGAKAIGENAVALGEQTYASGRGSLTEGLATYAMGNHSHAEGYGEEMSDDDHIKLELGYVSVDSVWEHTKINIATGDYAHVEGQQNIASGKGSHAEGFGSQSYSEGSHAEGKNTAAKGPYSHAEGVNTITSNSGEHAEGVYNKTNSNTLHSVGCGNTSVRKNAHEITTDGKHYVLGVGGYDGTNPQSSKDIVTILNSKTDIADTTVVSLPVLNSSYGGYLSDAQFEEYYRVWDNKGIIIFYGAAPQITFNRHYTDNSVTIYSVGTEISDDGTVKVYKCEVNKNSHNFTIQLIGTNSSAQPDWMADYGEDGYIKNRTHYVDLSQGMRFDSSRTDYMEIKNADGDIIALRFTGAYDQTTTSLIWHDKSNIDVPYECTVFNIGDKKSICHGMFDVSYEYGEGYEKEDYNTYFTFSNFVDPIEYVLSELLNLYEDWDNKMVHPLDDLYIPDSVKITLKEVSSTVYKDVF